MNEQELRAMDVRVHRVLYPDARVSYDSDAGPCVRIGLNWEIVSRYTTDLGAWEAVYALKPWRWSTNEFDTAVWVSLFVTSDPITTTVWEYEARGLAAYALGRARCVLAWAEGGAK